MTTILILRRRVVTDPTTGALGWQTINRYPNTDQGMRNARIDKALSPLNAEIIEVEEGDDIPSILTIATQVATDEAERLEAEEAAEIARIGAEYEAMLDRLARQRNCSICRGEGEIRMQTGGRRNRFWAKTCPCQRVAA